MRMPRMRATLRPRVPYSCITHGDTLAEVNIRGQKTCRECRIERAAKYNRAKGHREIVEPDKRFWMYVDISAGPESCWPWTKSRRDFGYGRMAFAGTVESANRIAWRLTNGDIPNGLLVLHSCDNPPCCNPKHLFLGTHEDNFADMVSKGRGAWQM